MSLVNLNKQCIARWFGCKLKYYCAVDWKNQESNRFSYRKVVSLFVQLISYHLLSFMRFRFIEQKFVCCATHSNILSHRIAYTSKVSVKHTNQQQHTTRTVNSDDWCADSCLLTRLPAVSILFLVVSLRYLQISHTVASIASKKVILLPVVWNEHKKNMRESKIKTRWNTSPFNYLHLLIVFSHHAFFSRAVRFIISHFNEFSVVSAFFFWRNLMVSLSVMPFVILYTSNEPTWQLNCNTLISIRWSEPHCLAVIQLEIFFSTEMRQILKDFELVFDV